MKLTQVSSRKSTKLRTISLLLIALFFHSAILTAQTAPITLSVRNVSLKEFLTEVGAKGNVFFSYKDVALSPKKDITFTANNESIESILTLVLDPKGLMFTITGSTIAIKAKPTGKQNQRTSMQISGTVQDDKNEPVIGANVSIKGTTNGTITDLDGRFKLDAQTGQVLIVSYIGYSPKEIAISDQTSYNISIAEDMQKLEEVVVVAYGTQKVRAVTGAMAKLSADELSDMPVPNVVQRMQGKFSGVQINQASGEPNGGMSIRIRGQTSINGGSAPLVVVDGFPVSRGIETFDPSEIENITILKDAASASLYGSRAANGVILITTKQAKAGKTTIELSANFGMQSVPNRGFPDVMNAQEFAQFMSEYYTDRNKYENRNDAIPDCWANPSQVQDGTDWYRILLRDAPTQNYNLTLTSGTEKLKSSISMGYSKQDGVMINQYAERWTARANNEFKVTDRISLGLNLSGSYDNKNIIPQIGGYRNIIGSAFLMDPQLKHQNEDGTYPISFQQPNMFAQPNYYLVMRDRQNQIRSKKGTINTYLNVEIINNLVYKLSANADLGSAVRTTFTPSWVNGKEMQAPPQPAVGSYGTDDYSNWLIENTLSYNKTFAKVHNINLLAGFTSQRWDSENSNIAATKFPDDELSWFNVATEKIGSGSTTKSTMMSYLGRINYDYDGKYLLSLSFRRDGSSRFGSAGKFANFPSVSAGWIMSEEAFMKKFEKLSYLKLRASWGKVGNNNIGDFTSLSTITGDNYVYGDNTLSGRAPSRIGNSALTWETTESFDIGADFGFFNDRIFLVYDYYFKKTDGLLYQINMPNQSGFGNIQANIGEFHFWGHEFSLETKNMVGKFQWSTNLNFTIPRNKAVKLGTNDVPIGGDSNRDRENRTEVGGPLSRFYGFINDGVFMTQAEYEAGAKYAGAMIGTVRFKDLNDDKVLDASDKDFIGDPNPDLLWGMTNDFKWNNFDASIVIQSSIGNDILDRSYEWTENLDAAFNVRKEVAQRWRSEEQPGNGQIPRTRTGTTEPFRRTSSRWIFDGSYVSLKNLTIGYNVPIKKNSYLSGLRVYASGQNLLLITPYHGMNPEISRDPSGGVTNAGGYGIDATAFPVARVFSLGLNVKF